MKNKLLFVLAAVTTIGLALPVFAIDYDPYTMKKEDFSKFKNDEEFKASDGNTYRIINKPYHKETWILAENKSGWNKIGKTYRYYSDKANRGKLSAEANYKNNKLDGKYKYCYRSGAYFERMYKNGKKHGIETFYNPDSSVNKTVEYKDGKNDGLETHYSTDYKTKKPYKSLVMSFKNGERDGWTTAYYSNGSISRKEKYVDGKITGRAYKYYKDGTRAEVANYKDGKKDGDYIKFYPNGFVKSKGKFENGVLKGKMQFFKKNTNMKYNDPMKNSSGVRG